MKAVVAVLLLHVLWTISSTIYHYVLSWGLEAIFYCNYYLLLRSRPPNWVIDHSWRSTKDVLIQQTGSLWRTFVLTSSATSIRQKQRWDLERRNQARNYACKPCEHSHTSCLSPKRTYKILKLFLRNPPTFIPSLVCPDCFIYMSSLWIYPSQVGN